MVRFWIIVGCVVHPIESWRLRRVIVREFKMRRL